MSAMKETTHFVGLAPASCCLNHARVCSIDLRRAARLGDQVSVGWITPSKLNCAKRARAFRGCFSESVCTISSNNRALESGEKIFLSLAP